MKKTFLNKNKEEYQVGLRGKKRQFGKPAGTTILGRE